MTLELYRSQLSTVIRCEERVVFIQAGRSMGLSTFVTRLNRHFSEQRHVKDLRLLRALPGRDPKRGRDDLLQWLDDPKGVFIVEHIEELLDEQLGARLQSADLSRAAARLYLTIASAFHKFDLLQDSEALGLRRWVRLVPWERDPDWVVHVEGAIEAALAGGEAPRGARRSRRAALVEAIVDEGQFHPWLLAFAVRWCRESLSERTERLDDAQRRALRAAIADEAARVLATNCAWLQGEEEQTMRIHRRLIAAQSEHDLAWITRPPQPTWQLLVQLAEREVEDIPLLRTWWLDALELSGLVVPTADLRALVLPDARLRTDGVREPSALTRDIVLRSETIRRRSEAAVSREVGAAPAARGASTRLRVVASTEDPDGHGSLRSADGRDVRFQSLAWKLLRVLAEARGRPVSIRDLQQKTGAVNEISVRSAMQRLLERLEHSEFDGIVVNVPRKGYCVDVSKLMP